MKELKFIAYRKQTLPWNDFVQKIEDNNDDDADALSSTIACKEMWSYKYYLRVMGDAKGKKESKNRVNLLFPIYVRILIVVF